VKWQKVILPSAANGYSAAEPPLPLWYE